MVMEKFVDELGHIIRLYTLTACEPMIGFVPIDHSEDIEPCRFHYPPLHFYYCQIDKILAEEWVMTYTACGIMVCFLLVLYRA